MVTMEFVSILKWVFIASFVCSSLGIENQNCDPNDLLALKQFAGNLTNGSIISAWSKDSKCCTWDGVVCNNLHTELVASRVIMLILPSRGLQGKISQAIGGLNQLQNLDLSNNTLKGDIPIGLLTLQHLEVLDLSYNMLSGSISEALGGLKALRLLNLSGNSLTGELLDLGAFPNLSVFNISINLLNGTIDSIICNASHALRILDLSMNRFSGVLMEDGLSNCSRSLQQLHVDSNSFSGYLPDSLFLMSSLEQLTLSSNNFSGQLGEKLSKLSRLKTLVISGNKFYGPLPNVFGNLTELEHLMLHSNNFSGLLPSSLSSCLMLQELDVHNNSLTGIVDLNFTQMPHLTTLDLASNHFHGPLPDTLSNCRKLKTLSVAKNKFHGNIPEDFVNLKSLTFLSLSNNTFANLSQALVVLQQCRNISTLILTRNFRDEEIPGNVSGFANLMILALGNCGLSGEIPMWLLNCRRLEVIDLSWNHLSGSIPQWIGQMENLFYVDISNNSLTGEIPRSLTDLKNLVSPNACAKATMSVSIPLYVKRNVSAHGLQYNQVSSFPPSLLLSNNKINGTLWPDIGRLKGLHVLDVSRNNITGTIPSTISDMENLEVLDLSYNDFIGSIPWSFNKLTFLSRFNVANNSLQGEIPSGGQFSSFPNSSFEGNRGLCGAQGPPCTRPEEIQSAIKSAPDGKIGRASILGITISIGVGIALILAVVLLRMSRKDVVDHIDDAEDFYGASRHSEAPGSSKLVLLFQNADCKELSIGDLLKSTNNFDQANIIGCGGFGLVYKASLPNGTKAAIKRLSGDCGQMEREFRAEVEALSRAQHQNLVPLQGYCKHGNDRLLIYSYMENGSLDYWLHERVDGGSVLKWDVRLKIARGAGKGLAYLHKGCEPNIVHRDIKSSNILLDEHFEAHLADFGLSRLLCPYDTHVTTDLVGTLGYIPPEYSQTLTATFKGDVYSFGVVLLELLTSRRPVDVCKGKGCRDLVSWVLQLKFEKKEEQIIDPLIWSKDLQKQFIDVLGIACKCIDQDPRRRPSIEQVVMWLDSVRTEDA
ncbi:Phytosulfokine receptor 2 [Ranunculus cassubicifolius]